MIDYGWSIKINDYYSLESFREKVKFLLNFAVLAPSTHNTQPWKFEIGSESLRLYYDEKFLLPQADPSRRNLFISLGCCLENFIIASKYYGMYKSHRYSQEGSLVAEVYLDDRSNSNPDKEIAGLFEIIPKRVNARGIFKQTLVHPESFDRVQDLGKELGVQISLFSDQGALQKISEWTAQGVQHAHSKRAFRREMSSWMSSSFSRRREGLPGYSLNMTKLLSLVFPRLIKYFNLGNFFSRLNYKCISSAPAIVVLSIPEQNRKFWVHTGQVAERAMLLLQKRGLKTSIFVGSIENTTTYGQLKELLGSSSEPAFLFCAGMMNTRPFYHTPRHSVDEKVI